MPGPVVGFQFDGALDQLFQFGGAEVVKGQEMSQCHLAALPLLHITAPSGGAGVGGPLKNQWAKDIEQRIDILPANNKRRQQAHDPLRRHVH